MSFKSDITQVCWECGVRYSYPKPASHYRGITYWEGKCGVCNKTFTIPSDLPFSTIQNGGVTSVIHFGNLPLLTAVTLQEEREGGEILRASEKLAKLEGRS